MLKPTVGIELDQSNQLVGSFNTAYPAGAAATALSHRNMDHLLDRELAALGFGPVSASMHDSRRTEDVENATWATHREHPQQRRLAGVLQADHGHVHLGRPTARRRSLARLHCTLSAIAIAARQRPRGARNGILIRDPLGVLETHQKSLMSQS